MYTGSEYCVLGSVFIFWPVWTDYNTILACLEPRLRTRPERIATFVTYMAHHILIVSACTRIVIYEFFCNGYFLGLLDMF